MATRMATKKGIVGIEAKGSKLRLRLPRSYSDQRYISTGLENNVSGYQMATAIAANIARDIELGVPVDRTLVKYGLAGIASIARDPISLQELWDKYSEFKRPQVSLSTYLGEYRGKFFRILQEISLDGIQSREYLLKNHTVIKCFSPAVVEAIICYQGFKVGFSLVGDPLFT